MLSKAWKISPGCLKAMFFESRICPISEKPVTWEFRKKYMSTDLPASCYLIFINFLCTL